MPRRPPPPPEIESRQWASADEIDRAVAKLKRRIAELEPLNIREEVLGHSGADEVA